MLIIEIIQQLEAFVNPNLQEPYDNSGIQVGDVNQEVKKILISLDPSDLVIDEAIEKGCNLLITHHPLIYKDKLKSITGKTPTERKLIKAIQNGLCIYSMHTSLDKVTYGVSSKLCEKLELQHCSILSPEKGHLHKIVVYSPKNKTEEIKNSMFAAGAGNIGNYEHCSFEVLGTGNFKPLAGSNPHLGKINMDERVEEYRLEMIYPAYLEHKIIENMLAAHPYEEVAYDIYSLENKMHNAGFGMIGNLKHAVSEKDFLQKVKDVFDVGCIKHSKLLQKEIQRVAVCGGSGSFLIADAIRQKADVYVSADFKYHDFYLPDNKILALDIGHYESEVLSKEIIYDYLIKKNPNFAVLKSEKEANPISYF